MKADYFVVVCSNDASFSALQNRQLSVLSVHRAFFIFSITPVNSCAVSAQCAQEEIDFQQNKKIPTWHS